MSPLLGVANTSDNVHNAEPLQQQKLSTVASWSTWAPLSPSYSLQLHNYKPTLLLDEQQVQAIYYNQHANHSYSDIG